jgi:hypothetical protein
MHSLHIMELVSGRKRRDSKGLRRAVQTRLQWMLFYVFDGRIVVRIVGAFWHQWPEFYSWKRRIDHRDLTTPGSVRAPPHETRQPTCTQS